MVDQEGPQQLLEPCFWNSQPPDPQAETIFIHYKLLSLWHSVIATESGLQQKILSSGMVIFQNFSKIMLA